MNIVKFGKVFKVKEWAGQSFQKNVVLDTETRLIESPADIPDLVITTIYDGSDTVFWCKNDQVYSLLESLKENIIIFHNAAFDVPVIEKSSKFNLDEFVLNNKMFDTALLYRLLHIATIGVEPKKWALDFLIETYLKEELEKNDEIRLTFGQYLNEDKSVNYDQISEKHLKYACLDVIATRIIFDILMKEFETVPTQTYCAHQLNLMGDIALAQITRNGIGVDLPYVENLKQEFTKKEQQASEIMAIYGVVRGKGFDSLYENAVKFLNLDLPVTESGKISGAEEDLLPYIHEPFIKSFLDFKGVEKQQNFLNDLKTERVYPRYNSLKNTSRSSCTRPNIQNMPRTGGIRESFVPAKDHVFLDIDYTAIELSAIASIMKRLFKYSIMADKINADEDLHKYTASQGYKIPISEVTKDQRQLAKIANFGNLADMAPATFVIQAKTAYGVNITIEEAIFWKEVFTKAFPEVKKYWMWARGKHTVLTHTGFVVANARYTQILNYQFQSCVAQGAKIMLYSLMRANYKVVAFVHDQVLVEIHKDLAEEHLPIVSNIMIESMSKVIVGVKVKVEAQIKEKFEK